MRIEYSFGLDSVEVPFFSVESTEGPQKLFTLATLVLNVLEAKRRVDVIFHSPNNADIPKKIGLFRQIIESAPTSPQLQYESGKSGSLGSVYYTWISIRSSGGGARG